MSEMWEIKVKMKQTWECGHEEQEREKQNDVVMKENFKACQTRVR